MDTLTAGVAVASQKAPAEATAEDRDQAKRSVDAMLRLYGFVAALALTVSTRNVFEPLFMGTASTAARPNTAEYLLFTALLFTVIPFYHGANRHMDVAHVYSRELARPRWVLVDFAMLFLESIILYCLALAVRDPNGFTNVLIALFTFDFLWACIAWKYTSEASRATLIRWLLSNVIAATVFAFVRRYCSTDWLPWFVAFLAVLRTVLDYWMNSEFYFHRAINEEQTVPASVVV